MLDVQSEGQRLGNSRLGWWCLLRQETLLVLTPLPSCMSVYRWQNVGGNAAMDYIRSHPRTSSYSLLISLDALETC